MENNSFEKDIASINKNYKVKSLLPFDSGIIWCENQVKPTVKSKVYIKYFSSDNKPTLIDESDSDILPSLAVTSKYLTYYIVNSNKLNIKIFNLSNNENTTIESYKLGDFSDMPYISTPNSNNKDVIWSFSKKGKSKILKYNIAEKKISEFNKSDSLSNPVFKNNKILAVKNMNFEDKELNISYASDYIVEYDYTQKKWVKFLENEINKYIDAPQESVINLSTNEGLLYWESTFSNGNYLYNFSNKKMYSLKKEKDNILTTINSINKNVVYYEAQNSNSQDKSKFIYIINK
ncbi:hypothetical protein QJR26_18880 (plasmid) [Clostridium baratii]